MSRSFRGGRRPVIYWAVCPECLTYIWVEESAVTDEETSDCPYCDIPISLMGGEELTARCKELQALLEDVERLISEMPAAVDVHRFLFEQVDFIASAFNDRLDDIQANKDMTDFGMAGAEAQTAG